MTQIDNPWLLPQSGATEGAGKLELSGVKYGQVISGTMNISPTSDLQIFWNNRRTPAGRSATGYERLFPSRLAVSAPNYPEMFDNPYAPSALYGDSIIDVNANDGQQLTGIATFFANSTTSGSNLEETLIAFKERDIYAVNLASRQVQRIESGGQGCTIPGSIARTKDGIMFANRSGIYMVTKNLDVIYVGDWIEDLWSTVDFDEAAERASGLNDALARKYKLSIPTTTTRNDNVVVFDYISATKQGGGWTRYNNFPSSDWTQTNEGTYFSSYDGRVFRLRDSGESSDYRDDASAISATVVYAPQSFGDTGSRAVLNRIITHIEGQVTQLVPSVAVDLEDTFFPLDPITVEGGTVGESVASSLPVRHALYFQIRYDHSNKDESVFLGGIDFKVTGLDELGITQAADSTKS